MISEVDVAKKCYQIWLKFAKKCHQIGLKVAKIVLLDKKNVTVRIYHKLSRDKKRAKG